MRALIHRHRRPKATAGDGDSEELRVWGQGGAYPWRAGSGCGSGSSVAAAGAAAAADSSRTASRCSSWRCCPRTCCRPPGTGPGLGAHTGPIGRSGPPGGRPALSRALVQQRTPRPGLPYKVAPTPPPLPPAPPRAAGPSAGARDQEAELAPARKVSVGKILAWSRRGKKARECPHPARGSPGPSYP